MGEAQGIIIGALVGIFLTIIFKQRVGHDEISSISSRIVYLNDRYS